MIGEPLHMKEHVKEFKKSLTPEEMEIHQRPDVIQAQKHIFKDMYREYKKARKAKKKAKDGTATEEDMQMLKDLETELHPEGEEHENE